MFSVFKRALFSACFTFVTLCNDIFMYYLLTCVFSISLQTTKQAITMSGFTHHSIFTAGTEQAFNKVLLSTQTTKDQCSFHMVYNTASRSVLGIYSLFLTCYYLSWQIPHSVKKPPFWSLPLQNLYTHRHSFAAHPCTCRISVTVCTLAYSSYWYLPHP